LRVLDLCYSAEVGPDDVLQVCRQHGASLRMLGIGGFVQMDRGMLGQILELCGTAVEHLGVGGCTGLGDTASSVLEALPDLCPSLTALNAHRLPGVVSRSALVSLLERLPALRSLDVHGTTFDAPLEGTCKSSSGHLLISSTPCGDLRAGDGGLRWHRLAQGSPGDFFEGGTDPPFISQAGCVVLRERWRSPAQ
jgi:hypothetical protein